MIGEILGSYRILSLLGEGGMGRVYVAEHPLIGRKAAVKILLEQYSANQSIVNRFFNEARTTALIKHPGLVDIFDFGYHASGCAYIVMELLEGQSLADRLKRQRVIPLAEAVEIARQIANAVGAAHARGIIHRDLKPDNIHLVADADMTIGLRVKILDFGIAKLAGDAGGNKTRTGAVLGTPAYMSPEQCRDTAGVDGRSDVYALGCILFQMLCGRTPFVGDSVGDLMAAHLRDPPPHPNSVNPTLSAPLSHAMLRLLAKRPEDRPASMTAVVAELEQAMRGVLPASPATVRSAVWEGQETVTQAMAHVLGGATPKSVPAVPPASRRPPMSATPPRMASARPSAPVSPVVVNSTTLSRSSRVQDVPRPTGSRRAVVIAGAATLALLMVGTAWFATVDREQPSVVRGSGATEGSAARSVEAMAVPTPPSPAPVEAESGAKPATVTPKLAPTHIEHKPAAPMPPPEAHVVTPSPSNESPAPAPVSDDAKAPVGVAPPLTVKPAAPKLANATVILHIDSVPQGAEIVGPDGEHVGITPFDDEVARGSTPHRYVLRLTGYRDGVLDLGTRHNGSRKVTLRAASAVGDKAPSAIGSKSSPTKTAAPSATAAKKKADPRSIMNPFEDPR